MYIDHFNKNSLFKSTYTYRKLKICGGGTLLAISFPRFLPIRSTRRWEHANSSSGFQGGLPLHRIWGPGCTPEAARAPPQASLCARRGPWDLPEMWRMQKNSTLGSTFTDFGSSLRCTCFPTPHASYYCLLC